MKYIVKFITADGCAAFEDRQSENRPEDYLYRLGSFAPRVSIHSDRLTELLPVTRRCYQISDSYTHPETGRLIFEYRELP